MSEHPTSQSPFPGMDPYLERSWGDVHARIAVYTSDYLQPQLPGGLHARVEEFVSLSGFDDSDSGSRFPDVVVQERPIGVSPEPPIDDAGVALAEPLIVTLEVPPSSRRHIAIVDEANRLVTAIEVLSPANKVGVHARNHYRQRQADLLAVGANLVEVDLVRQGGYVLMAPEERLPDSYREPYRACVVRTTVPTDVEVYQLGLRERMPAIRIPLRAADSDVGLDLHTVIGRVYEAGAYGRTIDYTRDPVPALSPEDAAWADELLKQKGLR